jgi:hypothetical protein
MSRISAIGMILNKTMPAHKKGAKPAAKAVA